MPVARGSLAPLVLVGLAVAFGLWTLRAEVADVAYPNDAAIHESMVRWAADQIRDGHLPLDGWYPALSLGASRFHHYQSLPHILTGGLSVLFGAGIFRWSLYLLLACWPVAVYAGARLFEIDRWGAAAAAVVAPLVSSAAGLGFEWGSYVWRGSGVWAQLWGMWALPFAWALGWRAVSRRGSLALAAVTIGLAVCLHLLIGYLALLSLAVWVLIVPSELGRRLWRASLVAVGALAVAAWMLVPLVADAGWTIHDEASTGTFYYDSFGAAKILSWLVRGRLFDARRVISTVSLLALVGLLSALVRWRRDESGRAIAGAGLLSLLLFFGRPTLGWAIDRLPGAEDLFLRRYLVGVHLAGVMLAGIGAAWMAPRLATALRERRISPSWAAGVVVVLSLAVFVPGAVERYRFEREGAGWIEEQRRSDATDGAALAALVEDADRLGPGRVYAGLRSRAGTIFDVGRVPAYLWLMRTDAEGFGFTRPTWSLMSGAEARFDPTRSSHYQVFGVRYAVVATTPRPVADATLVQTRPPFTLWIVDDAGPLRVVDTTTPIVADRTDLGSAAATFLGSDLPERGRYPTVAFGGRPPAQPTLARGDDQKGPAGEVTEVNAGPEEGVYEGRIRAERTAVVVLAASFDPRWRATVDGRQEPVQMIAPALVGVRVPRGAHHVVFTYDPISAATYAGLIAVGLLVLASLASWDRRSRRGRSDIRTTPNPPDLSVDEAGR